MEALKDRQDFSRFLVHLTKDSDENSAKENLVNIIETQRIYAKNHHCLFGYDLDKVSEDLKSKFNTVCFTETPLNELKHLAKPIKGRKVELSPYGLVFWRNLMIEDGANQAIYLNDKGTRLKHLLLEKFRDDFDNVNQFVDIKRKHNNYKDIIHYYSLVNIISDSYDFAWEREWRYHGDYIFRRNNIAAIIAQDPNEFENYCQQNCDDIIIKFIKYTPVINPDWGYEEVIEEMSKKLWRVRA
ncbi:TPA: hypothetical protein AB5E10_003439 [Vibrio cholerae]